MGEESHSKSRSEEESTCCCVEGMADKLKKFEGFFSTVFEENDGGITFVDGIIKDVQEDGQILHMKNVVKSIISGKTFFTFLFDDLYISICEITEFSPLFEVTPATAAQIDTYRNQVMQNTNAKRVN